jgi:RHS repeat-associated protein
MELKDYDMNYLITYQRVMIDNNGEIKEQKDFYPFGKEHENPDLITSTNRWGFNGKEKQTIRGLNFLDYGARMFDDFLGRWFVIDRFAEKYYSLSPYCYAANNPIRYIDLNGDSISIVHRTGFLGLGKKETLTYNSGDLYKADGSAYTGKIKGYLKSVVGALSSLNATTEGAALVSELQNSTNMFTIKNGSDNSFVPNNPANAGANLTEVQSATGNTAGSSGSGGTIYWNSNSTNGGLDITGSTVRPAYIGLGHEMAHASDSNQGLLHFSKDYTNAITGATYFSTHNGLLKSEWRAAYRENIIRRQAGLSFRTHYGVNMTTRVPTGMGPSLIMPVKAPFLPLIINLPINYR